MPRRAKVYLTRAIQSRIERALVCVCCASPLISSITRPLLGAGCDPCGSEPALTPGPFPETGKGKSRRDFTPSYPPCICKRGYKSGGRGRPSIPPKVERDRG